MGSYRDWFAYIKAYDLAMKVFHVSKRFPAEERYSLTDQLRRSTRSVCANLAEAYKRKTYKNHFQSKLNDADTENAETQVWLDISKDCNYLATLEHREFTSLNDEVGKLIWYMINNPEKFR
ncbi:MAG: four helix bundle protein [Chitinophagaceae bacterium]|nr:four helix bundle protein [Chitinophagaceae bacterium]